MGQVGKIFSLVCGHFITFLGTGTGFVNYALRLSGSDCICGQYSVDGKSRYAVQFLMSQEVEYLSAYCCKGLRIVSVIFRIGVSLLEMSFSK